MRLMSILPWNASLYSPIAVARWQGKRLPRSSRHRLKFTEAEFQWHGIPLHLWNWYWWRARRTSLVSTVSRRNEAQGITSPPLLETVRGDSGSHSTPYHPEMHVSKNWVF